ncbi:MAG: signal peptidase I, partial [Oscillospiraceae bacterium]|nr:signal peptidase I [Oscillospiraceae bacterium]
MDILKSSQPEQPEKKLTFRENVVLYLHDWVYLLAAVLVVFLIFFRVIVVSGDSMYKTLWDGDYLLLLSNVFYQEPQPGDIIVVSKKSFDNGSPIVKRVIAVEGQTVDIDFDAGIVYVDGVALDEPYTNTPTNLQEGNRFPMLVE